MFALSIVAIIYTSLVALAQEDVKKLIAYSSVAHMGFVTMGIFSFTVQGVDGAIFQMLSHGLVSAALFLCVGVVYDRMHTREIAAYGGLVNRMPIYAFVFMVFTLANVGPARHLGLRRRVPDAARRLQGQHLGGLPGHHRRDPVGGLCALSLPPHDLRAAREAGPAHHFRLGYREVVVFAPLVLLVVFFGFYPAPLLDVTAVSVKTLVSDYESAIKAASALNVR